MRWVVAGPSNGSCDAERGRVWQRCRSSLGAARAQQPRLAQRPTPELKPSLVGMLHKPKPTMGLRQPGRLPSPRDSAIQCRALRPRTCSRRMATSAIAAMRALRRTTRRQMDWTCGAGRKAKKGGTGRVGGAQFLVQNAPRQHARLAHVHVFRQQVLMAVHPKSRSPPIQITTVQCEGTHDVEGLAAELRGVDVQRVP